MFRPIMRNKKDLHLAGCIGDLISKTEIPDKLKDLDVISYVWTNNWKQTLNVTIIIIFTG